MCFVISRILFQRDWFSSISFLVVIPLGHELLPGSSDPTRKPTTGYRLGSLTNPSVSLFDLAPRRVWLFSLQQLPSALPFPGVGSMLWTFFLFHCSSTSTKPLLASCLPEGRYPLRCHGESGLSSLGPKPKREHLQSGGTITLRAKILKRAFYAAAFPLV